MVGQASSPDITMTSGDACPTNKGSLKVAIKGSLIYVQEFQTNAPPPLIPLTEGDNHLSPAGGGEGGGHLS